MLHLGIGLAYLRRGVPGYVPWSGGSPADATLDFLTDRIWSGGQERILSPLLTVSRASTATYVNSAGVMARADNNVLRLDYNPVTLAARGARLEQSRQNVLLRSEDLSTTWSGVATTVTTNTANGPDGTATLDKVIATAVAGGHTRTQTVSGTSNGSPYCLSAFFRAADYSKLVVSLYEGATFVRGVGATFDVNGTISESFTAGGATIIGSGTENWGGGLRRAWISFIIGGTDPSMFARLALHNGTTVSFTGDGSSGIHVGCVQLEPGRYPSTYMPTTTAAVTRAADSVSALLALIPTFNPLAGTLMVESSIDRVAAAQGVACELNDGGANNRLIVGFHSNNAPNAYHVVGGVYTHLMTSSNPAAGVIRKQTFTFQSADQGLSYNGGVEITAAGAGMPAVTTMRFGNNAALDASLDGHLRRVSYWSTVLGAAASEALGAGPELQA